MNIKELRKTYNITVEEASKTCGIPIRTYLRYEKNQQYGSDLKRAAIVNILNNKYKITEENGIYTIDSIKAHCQKVFKKYDNAVSFCYLFGSYAKGYAKENSDIDLLISTDLTGFNFLSLVEELKKELCKKIDLLRLTDQKNNIELLNEIMKDGIKIYG